MKSIVIAGSGPIGSFMAVLCTYLGFQVTVYEKRQEFTRNINLKIESDFFKKVQDMLNQLNLKTQFFARLNSQLQKQNNKILIRELEQKFMKESISHGAKYIIKEVKSFKELYRLHKSSSPLILDCTGRNSRLRISEFGPDESNVFTLPLQHAMYINCRAKRTENISSVYQVIKYIHTIKLGEVVVSKCKDKDDFTDITLPVFITSELAHTFDSEYPNINKEPLNPFNTSTPISDSIFFPVSSLLGNLIVDGCIIDLNSVKVKKIDISCGYAKRRSKDNYVCLGDAAIHLAFFRSLNLGFKHALTFFVKLSMFQEVIAYTDEDIIHHFKIHKEIVIQAEQDAEIIRQFKRSNPHLNPIKIYPTVVRNVFLVVTKVFWYGCFSYDLINHKTERLTCFSGVYEKDIINIYRELNEKLSTQRDCLRNFGAKKEGIYKELCCQELSTNSQRDNEVLRQFIHHYPHLNPIKVYPTVARNVFLVVTKIIWYGCYCYNLTNHETERLTNASGVCGRQIANILNELNQRLSSWSNLLADFETERDKDIWHEMQSNVTKNLLYDYMSWFIDINGKSFIKISELARVVNGKHALFKKDFEFILKCFRIRKQAIATGYDTIKILNGLMKLSIVNDAKISSSFILTLVENELAQIPNQHN